MSVTLLTFSQLEICSGSNQGVKVKLPFVKSGRFYTIYSVILDVLAAAFSYDYAPVF